MDEIKKFKLCDDNKFKLTHDDQEATHVMMSIKDYNNFIEGQRITAAAMRMSRERANAARNLRPKKEHSGYAVLSSEFFKYHYKNSTGKSCEQTCFRTIIQTHFVSSLSLDDFFDLYKLERRELYKKIGFDGFSPTFISNRFESEKNIVFDETFKNDFRAGYWTVTYYHSLDVKVPEDMMPPKKEYKKGNRDGKDD